jgi:hypothetical protein
MHLVFHYSITPTLLFPIIDERLCNSTQHTVNRHIFLSYEKSEWLEKNDV